MLKMTKQRTKILEFLKKQSSPVSAEDIYIEEFKHLNLSTVYRTLDSFYEHNLVNKYQLKNVYYYTLKTKTHKHYLVCEKCMQLIEIDCFIHDDLKSIIDKYNFNVSHHELNIYGLCSKCQNS